MYDLDPLSKVWSYSLSKTHNKLMEKIAQCNSPEKIFYNGPYNRIYFLQIQSKVL